MIGDASQHFAQIGFRVKTVEFRRADQTVDNGRSLTACIGTLQKDNSSAPE
jgi:hypothetical protein